MKGRLLSALTTVLVLAAACLLVVPAVGDARPFLGEDRREVRELGEFRYRAADIQSTVTLPGTLSGLPSGTAVTLYGEVEGGVRESLLVKSVFTPIHLYLDDELVYSYGYDGLPGFLNDPPVHLAIVPLPESNRPVALRAELVFPSQRSSMTLPALYVGSDRALLALLMRGHGVSFLFAMILLFLGGATALVSAVFAVKRPADSPFLWLGLASLTSGLWVLGECDLSMLLLPYPSLLYLLDYLGLFCVPIPFLRFGLIVVAPKNRLPLTLPLYVHYGSVAAAVLLQLTGTADLAKTLYWFHIISPLAFVVFGADLLLEFFRYRNPAAKRFAPAILLLAASIVLELVNYWVGMIDAFTLLFQLGLLAFIAWLGIVSGHYVSQSMSTAAENIRLEYELDAMARQIALQQEQYEEMMQNTRTVRVMRHDMRHHLAVVAGMADRGDTGGIKAYVAGWEERLAATRERSYCSNYAANAVASHYLGLAESEGVAVDVRLDIPADTGRVAAMDICVILGNLLENALEACRRMEAGQRFIRVRSRVDGDTLAVVVANSFDGRWQQAAGAYRSRKGAPDAHRTGVGLPSVRAVCEKYDGLMQIDISGQVWKASALVHMKAPTQAPGGRGFPPKKAREPAQ